MQVGEHRQLTDEDRDGAALGVLEAQQTREPGHSHKEGVRTACSAMSDGAQKCTAPTRARVGVIRAYFEFNLLIYWPYLPKQVGGRRASRLSTMEQLRITRTWLCAWTLVARDTCPAQYDDEAMHVGLART